mgnify:CR=1 FL=1
MGLPEVRARSRQLRKDVLGHQVGLSDAILALEGVVEDLCSSLEETGLFSEVSADSDKVES